VLAESRFKWGSAPNPVFGGNLLFLGGREEAEEEKDFRTPSTLERRTPVFALG
jgi:hypothetical protein